MLSLSKRGASPLIRVALAVALSSLAGVAMADIPQATLENAEALLKAGKADDSYKLLESLEVEGAGDLVYDYLLGTAALESNRPSKATFVYERILAVAPAYVGVRADMGRAYFALGDFGRAKIEFETVLSFQNLPNDLRAQVEQYAKAAEARSQQKTTVFNGYLELGIGRDSNVSSNTSLTSVYLPKIAFSLHPTEGNRPLDIQTADNYATLGLGGEVNHQLNEKWGLYAGADYRGRNYDSYQTEGGNWTLDGRTGLNYAGGSWLLRTGLTAGEYHQLGANVRSSGGANMDWRIALTSGSQVSAGLSVVQAKYVDSDKTIYDTQTNTVNFGWLTSLGDGTTILSLSASGGVELGIGARIEGNKQFLGPRLFIQKSFNNSLGAYLSVGATASKYQFEGDYYPFIREETLYDLALGLTWTVAKGVSVRPQLSYLRNNSNAELYSYDKTDFSLNVRYDF
jgi:tetratricopeptide (TPR) repeat protein